MGNALTSHVLDTYYKHRSLIIGTIYRSHLLRFFPAWITVDDIEQEVWLALCRWDQKASLNIFVRGVMVDILRQVRFPRLTGSQQSIEEKSQEAWGVQWATSWDALNEGDNSGFYHPPISYEPQWEARDIVRKLWEQSKPGMRRTLEVLPLGLPRDAAIHLGVSDSNVHQSRMRLRRMLKKLIKN